MKHDKDLDIKELVRKSFQDAMKQNGMLKEQEEQDSPIENTEAFTEKFDVEKHLSFLKIATQKWGVKGTVEANELDAVINAVVGGEPKGINRFKTALRNLNQILGKKPGMFAFPSGEPTDESLSNITSLFSSLQLNYILHSIIRNQDPSASGKMFEGLVSRMVGGYKSNEGDSIEDLIDDGGNKVSLKLIESGATNLQGSKTNLAKALSRMPPDKSIIYLVCDKDRNEDPFSFKAFSFKINRYNFLNYMFKKFGPEPLTPDFIESEKALHTRLKEEPKTAGGKKTAPTTSISEEAPEIALEGALKVYAETNNIDVSNEENIYASIRDIVDKNNQIIDSLSGNINDELYKNYFANLKLQTTQGKKSKPFTASTFNNFKKEVGKIVNLRFADSDLLRYFEDKSVLEKLKSIKDPEKYQREQNRLLSDRRNLYNQRLNSSLQIIQPVIKFAGDMVTALKGTSNKSREALKQTGKDYSTKVSSDQSIMSLIDNFIKEIADETRVFIQPQMDITIPVLKDIAASAGGDYDDDYEEFIVDSGFLLNNAKKSTELLRDWVTPIYENFHKMDNGLKKWYIKDEPVGLTEAENGADGLKTEIQKVPKTASGKYMKASDISQQTTKSTKLQENKKPLLTNPILNAILEELLEK